MSQYNDYQPASSGVGQDDETSGFSSSTPVALLISPVPLQLATQQKFRCGIPFAGFFVLVLTFFLAQTISENRLAAVSSSLGTSQLASDTFLGPAAACSSWSRTLSTTGYRADTISSTAVADSSGDWYFVDAVGTPVVVEEEEEEEETALRSRSRRISSSIPETILQVDEETRLDFRFRKLSASGVDVAAAPLFAQPPPLIPITSSSLSSSSSSVSLPISAVSPTRRRMRRQRRLSAAVNADVNTKSSIISSSQDISQSTRFPAASSAISSSAASAAAAATPFVSQRLYTSITLHEPSGTAVVLQNGIFNASSTASSSSSSYLKSPLEAGTQFSAIALHSTIDGFCKWGHSFIDPNGVGGGGRDTNNNITYACEIIDSEVYSVGFIPYTITLSSRVDAYYPTTTFFPRREYSTPTPPADSSTTPPPFRDDENDESCFSWVYLLGKIGTTPQIEGFRLIFPCSSSTSSGSEIESEISEKVADSFSSSVASAPASNGTMDEKKKTKQKKVGVGSRGRGGGGAAVLEQVWRQIPIACDGSNGPCADWDSGYGVGMTSLVLWDGLTTSSSTASTSTSTSTHHSFPFSPSLSSVDASYTRALLFASYPLLALDPWPNVTALMEMSGATAAEPMTELVALNTSSDSVAWSLSTDVKNDIPIVAVVSNIVVSSTGILYFAAVRNTTVAGTGEVLWERILVSMDGATGTILWAAGGEVFHPAEYLNPGDELELISIALTSSALVFCGLRPQNATDDGDFGLGAVDVAGGALLWRDTLTLADIRPYDSATRGWNPTRLAYCASNLLTDDKNLYAVVGQRPQLKDVVNAPYTVAEDTPLTELTPLTYVIYARSAADGRILWEKALGEASNADGGFGGGVSIPTFGTAGDYWSALQPFTLVPSPGRRLLMKYDSSVLLQQDDIQVSSSSRVLLGETAARSLVGGEGRKKQQPTLSVSSSSASLSSSSSAFSESQLTQGMVLSSFHCATRTTLPSQWVFLAIGVALSVLCLRACGGCMWATVTFKTYDMDALTARALHDAATEALRAGLMMHHHHQQQQQQRHGLPVVAAAASPKGNNSIATTTNTLTNGNNTRNGQSPRNNDQTTNNPSAASSRRHSNSSGGGGSSSRRSRRSSKGSDSSSRGRSRSSATNSSSTLGRRRGGMNSEARDEDKEEQKKKKKKLNSKMQVKQKDVEAATVEGAGVADLLQLGNTNDKSGTANSSRKNSLSSFPASTSGARKDEEQEEEEEEEHEEARDLAAKAGGASTTDTSDFEQDNNTRNSRILSSSATVGSSVLFPSLPPIPSPAQFVENMQRNERNMAAAVIAAGIPHHGDDAPSAPSMAFFSSGSETPQFQFQPGAANKNGGGGAAATTSTTVPLVTNSNSKWDPSLSDDLDALCTVTLFPSLLEKQSHQQQNSRARHLRSDRQYGQKTSSSFSSQHRPSAAAIQALGPETASAVTALVSKRSFCRTGSPWVFLTLLHYVAIIMLLFLSVQAASLAITNLQSVLLDPTQFYSNYLINRSPAADATCRSQAAAACYCTESSSADAISSSLSSVSSSVSAAAAACPAAGPTCDFDLSACARSCSVVLEETGNCAASVYAYSCGCGGDCAATQFLPNTTMTSMIGRSSATIGLPGGLSTCSVHYSTLQWVLWAAFSGYSLFAVAAIWLHLRIGETLRAYFCRRRSEKSDGGSGNGSNNTSSYANKNSRTTNSSSGNNSNNYTAANLQQPQRNMNKNRIAFSPTSWGEGIRQALQELSSGNGSLLSPVGSGIGGSTRAPLLEIPDRGRGGGVGGGKNETVNVYNTSSATLPSTPPSQKKILLTTSVKRESEEREEDSALAILSSPTAYVSHYRNELNSSNKNEAAGSAAAMGRGSIDDIRSKSSGSSSSSRRSSSSSSSSSRSPSTSTVGSRTISHIFFIVCCQGGVLLASFLWTWFLVLQGRSCTGSDGQLTGAGSPIVGTIVPPSKSLILRYVPGCAFGSSWQDADYEGAVLSSVTRCIIAQALAATLLLLDQGLSLIQACVHRCNYSPGGVGLLGAGVGAAGGKPSANGSSSSNNNYRRGVLSTSDGSSVANTTITTTMSNTQNTKNKVSESSSISVYACWGAFRRIRFRPLDTTKIWVPESWIGICTTTSAITSSSSGTSLSSGSSSSNKYTSTPSTAIPLSTSSRVRRLNLCSRRRVLSSSDGGEPSLRQQYETNSSNSVLGWKMGGNGGSSNRGSSLSNGYQPFGGSSSGGATTKTTTTTGGGRFATSNEDTNSHRPRGASITPTVMMDDELAQTGGSGGNYGNGNGSSRNGNRGFVTAVIFTLPFLQIRCGAPTGLEDFEDET